MSRRRPEIDEATRKFDAVLFVCALSSKSSMSPFARNIVWLLPLGLLVFAVVIVPLRMFDAQGVSRYKALQTELRQVNADNSRLTREVDSLTREVHALQSDPSAIERIARDELGMVREDEILFQFPN